MENGLIFHLDKDLPKPTKLKENYLREQVKYLATIPQHEQKSAEWYEMRQTMLSASDWGTILGVNHYAKPDSVLLKKCGEESFFPKAAKDAMAWGNKYEDVAISVYEHRNKKKILEFGCIRHPFIPFLGASPDGISEDGVMLEIKCPVSRKITGIPPEYYWCQVQGQLEVCELDRCDFLECKLREYENEEEYLNDHYKGNYELNEFGNEKGVVAEFYVAKEEKYIYFYGPVNIIGNKLEKWKKEIQEAHEVISDNQKNNIILSSFDYWYLEEVSCVPIYRNQEWFNDAKLKLGDFWEEVLYYREMGLDFLKEELNSQKEEKKKIKQEKKDAKAREQDAKKQKKIKDFINLNDDLEINNNININNEKINEVNDSNDDNSSINSDNESVFDDVFGNDAINITNQELKKENIIKSKSKSKIDIPENEFIDFEF
jgi:putative phage-type endonuclease